MSFAEFLGGLLGKMAAQAQEVNSFADEYRKSNMDVDSLWQEYRELDKLGKRNQCVAITMVLEEKYKEKCAQMSNEKLTKIHKDLENKSGVVNNVQRNAIEHVLRSRGYM